MYYNNYKLNEIYALTWPNLGWAAKYNQFTPKMTEPYPDEMFEEAERCEKSNRVLQRYNDYYNMECSGRSHGMPITPEDQQAMALECMRDALHCENLNREYTEIAIDDINDLIEALYHQGRQFIAKSEPLLKLAHERHGKDMDAV